jgi:SAM-dependent methyltransferase
MDVMLLTRPNEFFSNRYLEARQKEQRVFSDEQVAMLPEIPKRHRLYDEWKLRRKSAVRFLDYISKKNNPQKILDVGCGNGWFSNMLAKAGHEVTAIDINLPELEQAARIFDRPNLAFAYADIFETDALGLQSFDVIVLNSSFQYFSDAPKTVSALRKLLAADGEIHIIDSPFYGINEVEQARNRTRSYYNKLGFPDMARFYFHHVLEDLGDYTLLYRPSNLNFIKKDSPFYWILIQHTV